MLLSPLPATFYQRAGREHGVQEVARQLLGTRLVRSLAGQLLSGYIVETEAYQGESDLACHARAGYTKRTAVMYGPPGRAYVYLIYGMHWMLNCVTGPAGQPEAILIRAILPSSGVDEMARQRGLAASARRAAAELTGGPARLCQALAIDGALNNADLCDPHGELVIESGAREEIQEDMVHTGPRVGIQNVPEPWRSQPWRFWLPRWTGPAASLGQTV